jgi:hypothetical protein
MNAGLEMPAGPDGGSADDEQASAAADGPFLPNCWPLHECLEQ